MTTRTLLATLARRWYVVAAALVLTAAFAHHLGPAREVHWISADVVFLPPDRPDGTGNALEGEDQSLVFFAAAVEQAVGSEVPELRTASPEAPLYGTGVYDGATVTLPNNGGQWQTNYNQPVLSVQVVAGTAAAAQQRFARTLGIVEDAVARQQAELGVPASALIRTRLAPEQPQSVPVRGSTQRARAGVVLLGLGLAVGAGLLADLGAVCWRRRRRMRAVSCESGRRSLSWPTNRPHPRVARSLL